MSVEMEQAWQARYEAVVQEQAALAEEVNEAVAWLSAIGPDTTPGEMREIASEMHDGLKAKLVSLNLYNPPDSEDDE